MIGSTEHNEQVGFINWFHQKFPGVLIFAIPNGGARHIHTAIALRDEGVVQGIPDLFVPEWKLWIEMKRMRGGVVSKEQEKIISYLLHIGYTVIIGKGAGDASAQVLKFRET